MKRLLACWRHVDAALALTTGGRQPCYGLARTPLGSGTLYSTAQHSGAPLAPRHLPAMRRRSHMAPGYTEFPYPKELFLKFIAENDGEGAAALGRKAECRKGGLGLGYEHGGVGTERGEEARGCDWREALRRVAGGWGAVAASCAGARACKPRAWRALHYQAKRGFGRHPHATTTATLLDCPRRMSPPLSIRPRCRVHARQGGGAARGDLHPCPRPCLPGGKGEHCREPAAWRGGERLGQTATTWSV